MDRHDLAAGFAGVSNHPERGITGVEDDDVIGALPHFVRESIEITMDFPGQQAGQFGHPAAPVLHGNDPDGGVDALRHRFPADRTHQRDGVRQPGNRIDIAPGGEGASAETVQIVMCDEQDFHSFPIPIAVRVSGTSPRKRPADGPDHP